MHDEAKESREQPAPFIVTLQIDAASFAYFNGLRQHHFPPERNYLSAHLTLFHALPEAEETAIRETVRRVADETPVFPLLFTRPRFLGRGVAIDAESDTLLALHRRLSRDFERWLTPQDKQKLRPHITVQNKVTPEAARELLSQLSVTFTPFTGTGDGLLLYRYRGGPWEDEGQYPFAHGL